VLHQSDSRCRETLLVKIRLQGLQQNVYFVIFQMNILLIFLIKNIKINVGFGVLRVFGQLYEIKKNPMQFLVFLNFIFGNIVQYYNCNYREMFQLNTFQ
jgi:hypothetical protein